MPPVITSISPNTVQAGGSTSFLLTVRGVNLTQDSKVVFGGMELGSWFEDGVLKGTVLPEHYAQFSLGGVSVYVKQGGELSNPVLFETTQASPIDFHDVERVADALNNSLDLAGVSFDSNPYILPIEYVEVYRVKKEDTLQGIAKLVTGNPANWSVIAQINNLRYPYISDDPKVFAGSTQYTAVLTAKAFAGTTTVELNGASQFLTANAVLFFLLQNPLSDGTIRLISDVTRIDRVTQDIDNPHNAHVSLKSPIFNTYEAGHKIDVLATNGNTNLRVVTPGDYILVPSKSSKRGFVGGTSVDMNQVYEILGSDIWLDRNGNMREDLNGDLQSVIGLGNLNQAIDHRLVTELGELPYHSEYGNPLIDYVGKINNQTLMILANQEIQRTLLLDPRIRAIESIKTIVAGDTIYIKVAASVDVLNTTTEFNFVLPTR